MTMTSNRLLPKGLALIVTSFLLLCFLRNEPPKANKDFLRSATQEQFGDKTKVSQPTVQSREYVVKAVMLSSEQDQGKESLEHTFPVVDFIEGVDKNKVDLEFMASAKTFDQTWDFEDHRIRDVYSQEYCLEGEVARTLAHRRALEDFLHKDFATDFALLLEDDAVPTSGTILEEIDELISVSPEGWDFIQLGRCMDLWCDHNDEENLVASFGAAGSRNSTVALHESRGFELCSHAYLVTRKGAEKILQYSLPVMLPFDHTLMLLGRAGLLNEYFTSPRLFVQSADFNSTIQHVTSGTPECDPTGKERSKNISDKLGLYDPHMVARIMESPAQTMISSETRLLKDAPSPSTAEAARVQIVSSLCSNGNIEFCEDESLTSLSTANCRILGGSQLSGQIPSEPSRLFLRQLDEAHLDGVIIWGLRPDQDHPRWHIHASINGAVEEALMYSARERHLCYVKETPGFDLGKELYDDESRGKMARSLVFASPKHMTLSTDPGFLTLPVEATSRYIFHGETPRPHTALKRAGLAAEWETWGSDWNFPIIDSDSYVRGEVWKPKQGCIVDEVRKTFQCPSEGLFIQPLASEYTPTQILSNRKRAMSASLDDQTETLHFVDTIQSCNVQEFIDFTKGCADYGINVVRHGVWVLHQNSEEMSELEGLPNFSMQTMGGQTTEQLTQDLHQAVYAPAFQGTCNLQEDPSEPLIADRILNLISVGAYPMTNNPSAFEYLGSPEGVVFNPNTSQLCEKMMEHQSSQESLIELMDIVAREHTYTSRLSAILGFLSSSKTERVDGGVLGAEGGDFELQLSNQLEEHSRTSLARRMTVARHKKSRVSPRLSQDGLPNFGPTPSPTFDYDIPQFISTPAPVATQAPATPAPVSPAPATAAPVTQSPITPAPATPAPVATPAPATPAPVTPAPATPAPATSAPATPTPFSTPTPAPQGEITLREDSDLSLSLSLSFSIALFPRDIELRDDLFEFEERADTHTKRTKSHERMAKRPFLEDKPGERLSTAEGRRRRLIRVGA